MAGGVVIAAAARKQRLDRVLDAFRLADATDLERGRPLAELGLAPNAEIDELMRAGVISAGRKRSSWYLNEGAYIAFRDARPRRALRITLAIVVALLAALLGLLTATLHTNR
jgi:hypothetical protein